MTTALPLLDSLREPSDHAVSPAARRARLIGVLGTESEWSLSVDQVFADRLNDLLTTYREASRHDWDGHGAAPVSDGTLFQALALFLVLPSWLRNFEVSAHPDGELALEWYRERSWTFTVSINETGRLSYGALFASARRNCPARRIWIGGCE
jgi:hypothetical protein